MYKLTCSKGNVFKIKKILDEMDIVYIPFGLNQFFLDTNRLKVVLLKHELSNRWVFLYNIERA